MSPARGSRKTMSPAPKSIREEHLTRERGHRGHKCPKLPIWGISLYRTCFCSGPLCPLCPLQPNFPLLPIPLGFDSTHRTQFYWCRFAGDQDAFLRVSGCRVPHSPRERERLPRCLPARRGEPGHERGERRGSRSEADSNPQCYLSRPACNPQCYLAAGRPRTVGSAPSVRVNRWRRWQQADGARTGPGCAGRPGNARGSAVEHAPG